MNSRNNDKTHPHDGAASYHIVDQRMLFAFAELNYLASIANTVDATQDPTEAVSTLLELARKRLRSGRLAVEMVGNPRGRDLMTSLDDTREVVHNITNDHKLTVGAAGMAVASLVIAAHSTATLWGKKGEFLRQSILNMLRQERSEAIARWYTYHRLLQTRIPSLPDHHGHIGLVMVDGQLHFNHAGER
mgnify:CR=1 FL=1